MSEQYDYTKDGAPEWEDDKFQDFYTALRSKVQKQLKKHKNFWFGKYLLYVPDFFYLIYKLYKDPEVKSIEKKKLLGVLIYFISPINLIPAIIPGLGLIDDLYLAMIAVDSLLKTTPPQVVRKHWLGEEDVIVLIQQTIAELNEKIGSGAIKRLIEKYKGF